MKLIRVKNKEEMGVLAADIFSGAIKEKPDLILGLATGSTALPLYNELIKRNKAGEVDFSGVRTVNLDEYAGLSGTHEQSYRYYMNKNLFDQINIDPASTFLPDGTAEDPAAECARYDALLDSLGGVDLQLLGIGHNGHIAFIEPSDSFPKRTQYEFLAESTINANSRFFSDPSEVPKYAFSMGIRDIMYAKKIVMLAGAEKKNIVEKAVYGMITPEIPASILQLHLDATVILAEDV